MATVIALLILIPNLIYSGFVLSQLWTWFIVPLGVSAIGIAHAIGISTTLGLFRLNPYNAINPEMNTLAAQIVIFIGVSFALLIGYIVQLFM